MVYIEMPKKALGFHWQVNSTTTAIVYIDSEANLVTVYTNSGQYINTLLATVVIPV